MGDNAFLIDMGTRIAGQRKQLHLTQEQLADKMGLSLQSISCIELGKKAIRPENLAKLCQILGVSADYILYGRRSQQQMSALIAQMADLSPDAFDAIRSLVDLLSKSA